MPITRSSRAATAISASANACANVGRPALLLEPSFVGRIHVGADAVERARIALSRLETLAFRRAHVQEHGPRNTAGVRNNVAQAIVVVTVDGADVTEAHLLEDHRGLAFGRYELHRRGLGAGHRTARGRAERHVPEHVLGEFARARRPRLGAQHRKIRCDRPDVRRDRHLVIVEDHDEVRLQRPGVVDRFISEATGQRAVANDGHDRFLAATQIARRCHAERGRDRRGGVAGAERIERRLAAHRKARNSAALTQGVDPFRPAGQQFVDVGLVADIPHDLVLVHVQHAVQGQRQFDDAEVRCQVAAVDGADLDEDVADFFGKVVDIRAAQATQIRRRSQTFEHGPLFDAANAKPVQVPAGLPPPIPLRVRARVWTDVARIFSTVCNPFLTALLLVPDLGGRTLAYQHRLLGAARQQRVLHLDRPDALRLLALRHRSHFRSRYVQARGARAGLRRVRHLLRARHDRSVADRGTRNHHGLDGRLRGELARGPMDHALLEDFNPCARHHCALDRAVRDLWNAPAAVPHPHSNRLLGPRLSARPHRAASHRRRRA